MLLSEGFVDHFRVVVFRIDDFNIPMEMRVAAALKNWRTMELGIF